MQANPNPVTLGKKKQHVCKGAWVVPPLDTLQGCGLIFLQLHSCPGVNQGSRAFGFLSFAFCFSQMLLLADLTPLCLRTCLDLTPPLSSFLVPLLCSAYVSELGPLIPGTKLPLPGVFLRGTQPTPSRSVMGVSLSLCPVL